MIYEMYVILLSNLKLDLNNGYIYYVFGWKYVVIIKMLAFFKSSLKILV